VSDAVILRSGIQHAAAVAHFTNAFLGRTHTAGRDTGSGTGFAGGGKIPLADVAEIAALSVAVHAVFRIVDFLFHFFCADRDVSARMDANRRAGFSPVFAFIAVLEAVFIAALALMSRSVAAGGRADLTERTGFIGTAAALRAGKPALSLAHMAGDLSRSIAGRA